MNRKCTKVPAPNSDDDLMLCSREISVPHTDEIWLQLSMCMLTMSTVFTGIVYILMNLMTHCILMWHGIYQRTEIQIWQILCFQKTQGKQVTSLQNRM